MTKVLAVIPSNTFGGAHNQVLQLAARLEAGGLETVVLLPVEAGDADIRLERSSIRVLRLALLRPRAGAPRTWLDFVLRFPRQVRALHRAILDERADIVQAHGLLQFDVALAARFAGRPLVWQLLDTRPPRWLAAFVAPLMLACSTVVMTAGIVTVDSYPALKRSRTPVISFYPPVTPLAPEADGRAAGPVTFGCLANINPQKGYDFLIRAFSTAAMGDRARLLLRGAVADGHGRLHDELRHAVAGARDARIDLQVGRTTPREFLPRLDVLVLGSDRRSEGTPTVIIEAMHLGLPVIATRVGAVPELVRDGVTGFLVEPGDVSLMAERMRQLAGDAELRSSMGAEARSKATVAFTTENALDAYQRAYSMCRPRARAGD